MRNERIVIQAVRLSSGRMQKGDLIGVGWHDHVEGAEEVAVDLHRLAWLPSVSARTIINGVAKGRHSTSNNLTHAGAIGSSSEPDPWEPLIFCSGLALLDPPRTAHTILFQSFTFLIATDG